MSLNIKNEETCRLATEPARMTGETKTGAITVALQERLERERRTRDIEERRRELRAAAARRLGMNSMSLWRAPGSSPCR